ncbi:hypothetical protein [Arenibaculum pallidiluteum]|uniref:hypothetical protein n=1 Tax=Arenibaculum pallidiluteum TaxID=2812559 RepID=UPI001A97171D|nr:hypothetical protein [Arenibaculum pallidiluteum]
MGNAFTLPLIVMSLLSTGGFVAVVAYGLVRAAMMRRAVDAASERRSEEAAALGGLKETLDEKNRMVAERRLQRQRAHERLEDLKRRMAAAKQDRIEFVHELSEPSPRDRLFRFELGIDRTFLEDRPDDCPFSPEIWRRRNVAEVWAPSAEAAAELLGKAFPPSTGVARGAMRGAEVARAAEEVVS